MTSGFDGFARRLQAQLNQRMEEKTTSTVDLILLEAAWKDELKCESPHDWYNPVCSVDVTHAAFSCEVHGAKVCLATYKNRIRAQEEGQVCEQCLRPGSVCWSYRPI
jgi:hypothetical protein